MEHADSTEKMLNNLIKQGKLPLAFHDAKISRYRPNTSNRAKRIVHVNMRYKQRAIAPAECSSILTSIYHVL